MSEYLVVNDTRSGVMLVRNGERLVAVWSAVFQIDRSLQPDEKEVKLKVRIHRGERGAPVLLTKRGNRSSFLTGKMLRKFERENGLQVKPVDLGILNSMATSECGRPWRELTRKESLQVLQWLSEG